METWVKPSTDGNAVIAWGGTSNNGPHMILPGNNTLASWFLGRCRRERNWSRYYGISSHCWNLRRVKSKIIQRRIADCWTYCGVAYYFV